ncbi:MAG: dihydroorotase family protein [Anaerolineae bacterium]|nr:dihydroorotase family protein [Anaerolineae bacterium]
MQSTLIRNGTRVTPQDASRGDILIRGESIVAVGVGLSAPPGARVVDANGLLIFPGLIDPHVHLREPGGEHKEDFLSGTRAALAGGFTTVLAMPNTSPALTDHETLAQARASATSKAVCDVGFFVGATADNTEQAAELKGVVGLKLYMGSSTGSLLVADLAGQAAHFERYRGVVAVHAEDEEAVEYFRTRAHFAAHGQRRPPICASLAVSRALALAERFETRLHICHVSTAHELALIRDAKARDVKATCEVTPHHLFLDSEDETRLGALGQMNPPLRAQKDVDVLWENLDIVDCIATDHAPHTLEEKRGPTPPSGVPGLETALALMLTAVHEGRLPLAEIARLMATGPARVFGLERKGHIAPGYDADLTLVDINAEWTIGEWPLQTKCGWSPFEEHRVKGAVKQVFLRGQEVYSNKRILAKPGYGQVIPS